MLSGRFGHRTLGAGPLAGQARRTVPLWSSPSLVSFSNTLGWNNLPLPAVDDAQRAAISHAGRSVLGARSLHPDRTLAQHYNPLGMDTDLVNAHRALDRVVDKAFGAPRGTATEAQRQKVLFARYAELTAPV